MVSDQVIDSYSGILPSEPDLIRLPALNNYLQDGSGICIHKKTGLLTSSFTLSETDIANYWSSSIFAVRNEDNYTATRPFAQARLYYVALTAIQVFGDHNIPVESVCDFATGESVFPDILSRLASFDICVTETSPSLRDLAVYKGYEAHDVTFGEAHSSTFMVDAAFLTWTLCNCRNPLGAVQTVVKHVKPGGCVVIADSSRIMVPFKKSLSDLLTKDHPIDIHPYFFSINTLRGVAELAGLQFLFSNRYRDSDVMMAIFRKPIEPIAPTHIPGDDPMQVMEFVNYYHQYSEFFTQLSC